MGRWSFVLTAGALVLVGSAVASCRSERVSTQGIHAPCTRDKDCERGLECQSGVCALRCEEDDDCPKAYRCERDFCVTVADGGEARAVDGQVGDAGAALD